MPDRFRRCGGAALVCLVLSAALPHAQPARRPLGAADIDALVRLLALEDTRQFDEATLARLLRSAHPEVRRRAVVAVARIANPGGRALVTELRRDPDPEVVASVAFAAGQLKDPGAVAWLTQALTDPSTPPPIAQEAARSLGKIRTPDARAGLTQYLGGAPYASAPAAVVGEALLSIGRFPERGDLAPVVRWATSSEVEVRWRTAWALFRPRDPAALPHCLKLADDPSPLVRFWAMRGLARPIVAEAGGDSAQVAARLRDGVRDVDRQVRTEALRTLVTYDDDASVNAVLAALDSTDTWLSVSAAEGLGQLKGRADQIVPRLVSAAAVTRPLALRITILEALAALAPGPAADLAAALAREKSVSARSTAMQVLSKLGAVGKAKLDELSQDPSLKDLLPAAPPPRPAPAKRSEADYRRIVERWIVADYNGAERPRATLATTRGEIDVELYPGDAPLGVDQFVALVESGAIVGTEFGRVVPNFVAQQRPIRDAATHRDEVNRRGLTRANVSWASAGLDTGRPGYTFGVTPQPHNEGDFTALGRVIRGMEVVDRFERGDAIVGAKIIK
jgi:cyclophilin family peptidyl-prolyl cis-trans isomerase/HEAT repeat protein